MRKERITDKEAIVLLCVFIIGSSLILGSGREAKNDGWIAVILGLAMAVPMLLVYCRLLCLYPGISLFDIIGDVLGKVAGTAVSAVYVFYSFHLGALVLRNFGDFCTIVAMPETPMLVPLLFMGIICIIASRMGVEVLGRMTTYFFPILLAILLLVQLLALPQIHLEYLKPILANGMQPVMAGAFSTFSFPFAETVLFLGTFSALKTKRSAYRIFFWGFLIAASIIFIVTIRNISVLGNMAGSFYFPSYAAVSRIKIGDFIQRIEVTVSFVFVYCVLMKSAVCLLVASKGIASLFGLRDYRTVVIQTGLLMIYFAYTVYRTSMEMASWATQVYPYYAFPMQVMLPLLLWVLAEIKAKKRSSSTTA